MAQSVPTRHTAQPKKFLARKTDEQRKTSTQRGYNEAWAKYSKRLREERTFCELCLEAFGIETPIAGQITTESGRKKSQGVTDHILPVANSADPIFWADFNHLCLCDVPGPDGRLSCNYYKSLRFDGSMAKPKIVATSRDRGGVERRRREIVEAIRLDVLGRG